MAKKLAESIKHPKDKWVHIPSKEEAGYEDANPKVQRTSPQPLSQRRGANT